MNGFLLIDKPPGFTSNDVLNVLKKKTGIRKMGHTGTLDPFATGLLIVAIGRATKLIPSLNDEPKIYEATLKLGELTDTLDREGKIIETKPVPPLDPSMIERVLKSFLGKLQQIPPMFSAKKMKGKRLYELARRGLIVERKPREIEIFELALVTDQGPDGGDQGPGTSDQGLKALGQGSLVTGHWSRVSPFLSFRVSCSRGTYVRVLGADISMALGTVGHLIRLRRFQAGNFHVEDAVDPESDFSLEEKLVSMKTALAHLPSVDLSSAEAKKIGQGQPVTASNPGKDIVALISEGDLLGIGEFRGHELWPKRLILDS